ncbi:MAG: DUF530 domain-containing protein [Methanobacteriaceae archaeon]|nr:DUF530 domain-containing protein [Methanobacteriaceae archaeon]
MEEPALIAKSERFLESIKTHKISLDDLIDPKGFVETYTYLRSNLTKLQKIKKRMELKGFKTPYRSVAIYGPPLKGELKAEDLHDIRRQAQYFRMKASLKKNILDRVNSAIASHKIALGHLEEHGILNCPRCGKVFKLGELPENELRECECGSNLQVKFEEGNIKRPEIIPHLPLSGDYMVKISQLTPWARESFKEIIRLLKDEKSGTITSATMIVKIPKSGRWIRKKMTIEDIDHVDYEEKLKQEYGPHARIEFIQFHRRKSTIINDRHIRTALALGYSGFVQDFIAKRENEIFKKRLKKPQLVKRYDEILEEAREYSLPFTGEELEEIRKRRLRNLLIREGLADKNGNLRSDLKSDLELREKIIKNIFSKIPITLILWDITCYYLTTSYDRRSKYAGPFPGLGPVLDRRQSKTFNKMDREAVKLLREYGEKIFYIKNLQKLLLKKFEIEEKIKGLHMKINQRAFGAAIINLESDIDEKTCANIFSITLNELKKEKENIKALTKPTNKARLFMEMIK